MLNHNGLLDGQGSAGDGNRAGRSLVVGLFVSGGVSVMTKPKGLGEVLEGHLVQTFGEALANVELCKHGPQLLEQHVQTHKPKTIARTILPVIK